MENELRQSIATALATVTKNNAPNIYNAIQSESGYKIIESAIILEMCISNCNASASVLLVENKL
jgi:hypothetical protein